MTYLKHDGPFNAIRKWLKVNKPNSATMEEWNEWEENFKTNRPFAFWLTETAPDAISDAYSTLTKPFNSVRYWVRYRLFDRYHVVPTGLKPNYYDTDSRMLHGMFQLLVDYIEVEKAWIHYVFGTKEDKAKYRMPWYSVGSLRFKSFRCAAAGLDHLAWEMTLDSPDLKEDERSPHQAASAREQLALYEWWTKVRPKRPDPHDASGWTEYCNNRSTPWWKPDTKSSEILDRCRQIEEQYDREDTEMLKRLIDIRQSLWT